MKKIYIFVLLVLASTITIAQTPVPMASQPGLTYTETFADIANWAANFASGTGANRFGAVAVNATGTIPDGVRTTTSTATFATGTSGGVQKGSAQTPATQSIVLLATGATDNTSAVAIDFFMDFTGVNAGTLSFDWATIFNSTGDRKGSLRVYYSTNGTAFTEIPAAQVLNITNNVAGSGSITSVALPAAFNNSATARLRFYYYNGTGGTTGSRPKINIDNLTVTATALPAGNTVSVAAGSNATEPAGNGSFTITFNAATTVSTDVNFAFTGSADFGTDYTVSFSAGTPSSAAASATLTVPAGTSAVTVTVSPLNDILIEGTESITLGLSDPTAGYTTGTASATISLIDDDLAPTVSVAAGSNAAEPATNGTFNITLSAAAPAGGVTVNYTLGGTAVASDYTDPQSGSVTITAGNTTGVITLNVTDDMVPEPAKTISITLNNATNGYVIGTASATINLLDDDINPVSLTGTYTQDFNTLASTGTSSTVPAGWAFSESGTSANTIYTAGTGSSNSGDTYSFGAASNTERAFGSLRSGSVVPSLGGYFVNNTGSTISALKITYTGEQWRLGATGRNDRMDFQYSVDATSLSAGTWTDVDQLDFIAPNAAGTAGALDGNAVANKALVSSTITGISIANGATFFIRWNDFDATGADDGLGIDDLSIEANPVDVTPPVITALSPANNATNVSVNLAATITFNETIQKGSGNIVVKRVSDNSVFQTIDVTTAAVSVSVTSATFNLVGLSANTGYYIEVDNGAFRDLAGNNFAGISGPATWSFTSGSVFYTADFNTCSSSLTDGFTQFSETGAIVWACTAFGRDPANPAGTAAYQSAVQINGFSGGTNVPNIDWLISPSFDLTSTTYPLLSFWSRTAFNGLPLQLKVSTNYTGGDPTLATWTDINGKFPAQTSNIWMLSSNINLSAFKGPNVHFAFVYTSTMDDGARWTLDDVQLDNSATPPPPSLTANTTDIQFGYVAPASTSVKTFTFTGNDLTGPVTLTSSTNFALSKDNSTFSSSISYTQAEANNVQETVYVRFGPDQDNQNYTGNIIIGTNGVTDIGINLKGTTIDPVKTLEVVNWNLEWFGSTDPTLGPTNDALQEQNVETILKNIGADLYGVVEVVDEARLANVVSHMPGYAYVICNYGSHTNTKEPGATPLNQAQKEAFIYKTALFSNISTQPLLSQGINTTEDLSNPAYSYFASGRFPFMMTADVTLDGTTRTIRFILIHAKANTSPTATSYDRRKKGADTLHYTLNTLYPTDRIVMLGDFNDDLDQSITAGFTTTSYDAFTTDNANFFSPTLALSLAGKKSTVSYNDVIDHVMLSNEMQGSYMSGTANILADVTSLVSNYGSTTTDHYPVFTRYTFSANIPLPVTLIDFAAAKQTGKVKLTWSTSQEINSRSFVIERSLDGVNFTVIGTVNATGSSSVTRSYEWIDNAPYKSANFYRLKLVDADSKYKYSKVLKISFTNSATISLRPNPISDFVNVWFNGITNTTVDFTLTDLSGKTLKHQANAVAGNQPVTIRLNGLSTGIYILHVSSASDNWTEKVVIQ